MDTIFQFREVGLEYYNCDNNTNAKNTQRMVNQRRIGELHYVTFKQAFRLLFQTFTTKIISGHVKCHTVFQMLTLITRLIFRCVRRGIKKKKNCQWLLHIL